MNSYRFPVEVEILADSQEDAERQAEKLCEEFFSHGYVMALHGDRPTKGGIEDAG